MIIDPADYIIALMRAETDALGFIPSSHIRNKLVPREQYLIQKDNLGFPRGYLLHGPIRTGQPLRIYQACIDVDHRRITYGTRAVQTLIERATKHNATEIILRCATDLPANTFWLSLGAILLGQQPGGKRRNRTINIYSIPLPTTKPQTLAF